MITESDILSINGWFKLPSNGKWARDVFANRRNKYWHVWFNDNKSKLRYYNGSKNHIEIEINSREEFIVWANNQMNEIEITLLKTKKP